MALLGNYPESEKQYDIIVGVISGILKSPVADDRAARKWEAVLKQIRDEVEAVRQIKSAWASMGEFGGGTGSGDAAASNGQPVAPERCNMLDDFFTASMAKDSPAHRQLHRADDEVRGSSPPVWDGVIAPPSPRDNDRRDSGSERKPKQRADPEQLPGWAQGREPPPVRAKPRPQPHPDRGSGGPPPRGAGGPPARQRNSYAGPPANDAPSGGRN